MGKRISEQELVLDGIDARMQRLRDEIAELEVLRASKAGKTRAKRSSKTAPAAKAAAPAKAAKAGGSQKGGSWSPARRKAFEEAKQRKASKGTSDGTTEQDNPFAGVPMAEPVEA